MDFRLYDIADVTKLNSLLASFYKITEAPLTIVDNDGNILAAVGYTDHYSKYKSTDYKGYNKRKKSNTANIEKILEGRSCRIYDCGDGIIKIGTQFTAEGYKIGSIFLGHFFLNEPDIEYFRNIAIILGFHESEYIESIKNIPVINESRIKSILDIVVQFCEVIADIGYKYNNWIEMQQKLQLSEERLKLAVEGTKDAIIDLDIENNEVYLSEVWSKILGYKDPITGLSFRKLMKLVHPEDVYTVSSSIGKLFKDKQQNCSFECRLKDQEGKYKWILNRGILKYDSTGRPNRYVGVITDIAERKNSEQTIKELAFNDTLTGLVNRTYFINQLEQELRKGKNKSNKGALLFLDLDDFKQVNDLYGHPVGDALLTLVGDKLKSFVSHNHTIARIGGDEFTILIKKIQSFEEVYDYANRILIMFKDIWYISEHKLSITASVGITFYPVDGTSALELFRNADMAMYSAKEQGKNKCMVYSKIFTRQKMASTSGGGFRLL